MHKNRASWTAVYAAARRAIESEKPAAERICYDPLAKKFIGSTRYFLIKSMVAVEERWNKPLPKYILFRRRFFDGYVQKRLASGITQLVILGAGWDSTAYRGEFLEGRVKTFEVDHPATQREKIRSIRKIFPIIPAHIVYVPIDFYGGTLDPLLAHGFDRTQKTLFILEGVTQYLNTEVVESILAWIGSRAAAQSTILLDYQQRHEWKRIPKKDRSVFSILGRFSSEERSHGMERHQMEELLSRRGFVNIMEMDAKEHAHLSHAGSNPSRKVWRRAAIVCAEIGENKSPLLDLKP